MVMNLEEKRGELISYFREQLRDKTAEAKAADESQRELIELQLQKITFSLLLMEDGQTVFNGEKIELNDTKIEMMYRNYLEDPM
jgi:hypothetical protein